jgi:TPR repeat protein
MPKAMRPVVKIEDGAGGGHAEEGRQEEADAGGERQRRRLNDAGDAVSAEAGLIFRASAELQAQVIEGMERTRVQGEELQRAKVRIAELAAEVKMREEALQAKEALLQTITKSKDEALQSKDVLLQTITKSNDAVLQSKDELLLCKDALLQAKDAEMKTITKSKEELLQAKDAEIRLLHADNARLSAQAAAAGAAPPPAPAPAAARAAAASAEAVFQEGQRLYGEQRFSEAAERWGRAALLQHAPSHAHLSDMLVDGRAGVFKDKNRGFELASAGAALGCAHSKGALGCCYVWGDGVAKDAARGHALGRESAAAGSCFGQYAVGLCYDFGRGGVAQDYAEAVRLYRLAADQGHAHAQVNLGTMFANGEGVAKGRAEAIRWYRLAAAQGHASATSALMQLRA